MNAPTNSSNNNYRQHRRSSFNDSSGGRSFNESDLRRSFVAIHRSNNSSPTSPVVLNNPTSTNNNNNNGGRRSSTENAPRSRPRLKKQSLQRRHSMNHPNRRVSIETAYGDGQMQMPSLPFSNAEAIAAYPPPPPPPHHCSRDNGGRQGSNHHAASSRRSFHNTNNAKDLQPDHQASHQVRRRRSHEDEGHHHHNIKQSPRRRVTVSFAPSDEQLQQLGQQYAQDHLYDQPSPPPPRDPPMHHQQQQQQVGLHKGFRPDYVLGEYSRDTSHMIMPQDDVHAMQLVNTLSKHDFAFVKRLNGTYSYAILAYRTSSSNTNEDDNEKKSEEGIAFVMDDSGSTKMIRKKYWCEYIRLVSMQDCSMITAPTEDAMKNDMNCGIEEMLYPSTHQQRMSPPVHQEKTHDVHQQHHRPSSQDHHQDSEENVVLCQEIPMVCQEIPAPHPRKHDHQASQVNSMGFCHNQEEEEEEEEEEEDDDNDDCTAPLPEMITVRPQENNEECSLISSVSERARREVWRY